MMNNEAWRKIMAITERPAPTDAADSFKRMKEVIPLVLEAEGNPATLAVITSLVIMLEKAYKRIDTLEEMMVS